VQAHGGPPWAGEGRRGAGGRPSAPRGGLVVDEARAPGVNAPATAPDDGDRLSRQSPAAALSAAALSVFSQVKSGSSRPKWP